MITDEQIGKLRDYAKLEASQIGDFVNGMIILKRYAVNHGSSQDLGEALDKELLFWLSRFENETVIEERNEPQPDRVIQELVWLDE